MARAVIWILGGLILGILFTDTLLPSHSFSQSSPAITPTTGAGNLGTMVTQGGRTYHITGGTRPDGGPNLFHSFAEFGVPTNHVANFLNDSGLTTTNILSRVTGGNPSNIFGTIQTTGFGAANLFLMNPAGIVFGPNASLNVGGSVSLTTADYLRLADGAHFNAFPGPADAFISSAPVAAYGFLGSNPAAITVQGGQLSVPPGQSVSLVGGDLTIQAAPPGSNVVEPARLSAPGGQVYLASAKSTGEFATQNLEQGPNVNGQVFGALGTVQVSQKSLIDSSGDGGGAVVIRGGRFLIDDSRISANTTGADTRAVAHPAGAGIDIEVSQDALIQNMAILETNVAPTAPPGAGSGGVHVKAARIEIVGIADAETPSQTGIQSIVQSGSQGGNSGDISLEAGAIRLKDFGSIKSNTEGLGNAGKISIRATGNIDIETASSVSSVSGSDLGPAVSGNTGTIELYSQHGNIRIDGVGGSIQPVAYTETLPNGSGNTGGITVIATEGDVLLLNTAAIFTRTRGAGSTGPIELQARNLVMSKGVLADINFGLIRPDGVTVSLSDRLSMADRSVLSTGSFSPSGTGAADLRVAAPNIELSERSLITSSNFASGQAGNLTLNADSLRITGGAQVTSASVQFSRGAIVLPPPTGSAGNVTIQANGGPVASLIIDGSGSRISTDTAGTGAGGNIHVAAQSVAVQNGGTISASTSGASANATGGNIMISAKQSVALNNGGSITAASTGPANAGNITINAGAQFLSNNGSVTTQASQASGGNITIQATDSIRLVNSQLSTSVQGGPNTTGGNILLDPAVVTLQNSQVTAQAVQGTGGNINIIAGTFLADPTSVVSASSQFGLSGAVNIQSPVSNLSGSLATLPQRPLQAHTLLRQHCAAQANGQLSSLVVSGRDSLPIEPGGWQLSPLAFMTDGEPNREDQVITKLVSGQFQQRHVDQDGFFSQRGAWDRETGCGS